MTDVYNYAKYFIKRGLDTNPNTFDGNMKLQKLLVFANLISLAINNKTLFDEPVSAFSNGCVVEKVRLRYRNDYRGFLADSQEFEPNFDQKEYDILNLTANIFGPLSAKELSHMTHSFIFWREAYQKSIQPNGYKDKNDAIIPIESMKQEVNKIKQVIDAYQSTQSEKCFKEIINGIEFYYNPDEIVIDGEVLNQLEKFSNVADDSSYSVYEENGGLVIY